MVGGFAGSALHGLIGPKPTTVRAERFEIINSSGHLASFWGPDPDPQISPGTLRGTLMVFLDPNGVRRCQVGTSLGDYGPVILFSGKEGPRGASIQQDQYRLWLGLGDHEDPFLYMRGSNGSQVKLGAEHGDAPGPGEDQWGLSLRAWQVRAAASIGFTRWPDGHYRAGVHLDDGEGSRWNASAGAPLKPLPLVKRSRK